MIRVAIVDSHSVARAGLRSFLASHTEFRIVVDDAAPAAAIQAARQASVDVLVMGLSGVPAETESTLLSVKHLAPRLPVMVLSDKPDPNLAREFLQRGADCFMDKALDAASAIEGIRALYQRRRCCGTPCMQGQAAAASLGRPRHKVLSGREYEVFLRLAHGGSVGEIAVVMAISLKTVSTFRMRLLKKMGLKTNSDLTYYAVKNGLFQHGPAPTGCGPALSSSTIRPEPAGSSMAGGWR